VLDLTADELRLLKGVEPPMPPPQKKRTRIQPMVNKKFDALYLIENAVAQELKDQTP
jgi:hypothetical protein